MKISKKNQNSIVLNYLKTEQVGPGLPCLQKFRSTDVLEAETSFSKSQNSKPISDIAQIDLGMEKKY